MTPSVVSQAASTDTRLMRRLEPAGDLTVQVAAERKVQLLAALDAAEHLVLDLGQITEIDTAGVQLLLLLAHEARLAGKLLEATGHSRAVLDVYALAQLRPGLDDAHDPRVGARR